MRKEREIPEFDWEVESMMDACCALVNGNCSRGRADDVECFECLFDSRDVRSGQRRQFLDFCRETGMFNTEVK